MLFIPQQLLSDMTSLGASKSGDYSASESDDIINFDNIFSMIDTEDSDLSNILSDAHENLTAIVHELPQAEEFSEMWQEFAAALPENMPINADEARQKSQVVLEQLQPLIERLATMIVPDNAKSIDVIQGPSNLLPASAIVQDIEAAELKTQHQFIQAQSYLQELAQKLVLNESNEIQGNKTLNAVINDIKAALTNISESTELFKTQSHSKELQIPTAKELLLANTTEHQSNLTKQTSVKVDTEGVQNYYGSKVSGDIFDKGFAKGKDKLIEAPGKIEAFNALFEPQQQISTIITQPTHIASAVNAIAKDNPYIVNQLSQELNVNSSQFIDKVASRLQYFMMNGQSTSANIRLDPPELGPLMVNIEIRNDMADLLMQSEHESVKALLEDSASKIRELLREQGIKLGSFEVEQREASHDKSSSHTDDSFAEHQRHEERDEANEITFEELAQPKTNDDQLVSIYV